MESELNFNPNMVSKPFVELRPGAYTGKSFGAKKMVEMCELKFDSLYTNINTRRFV